MNIYRFLKEKIKTEIRDSDYIELLTDILVSMFDYEGTYEGFYKKQIEMSFLHGGKVMTKKMDGQLVTVPCDSVGLQDDHGQYVYFKGYTLNGKVLDGTRDVDCVIGYNNDIGSPDLNIERYATMFSDIDLSLDYGVVNTRNVPIPTVSDTKTKAAIEAAQTAIRDGKPAVILDDNVLHTLETGAKSIDIVQLTDPTLSDKLQYLSKLHDDYIRRFATIYGHDFNGSPKSAQQSIKEIEGSESFSWIIPVNMLKCRKDWCDKVNEMFGTNMSVKFSPTWEVQYQKFLRMDEVEQSDELPEDEDLVKEGAEDNGVIE